MLTQTIIREIERKKEEEKKHEDDLIQERFNKLHRRLKLI